MTTTWWDAAASVFIGATCPGCGRPGAGLCPPCDAILADPAPFAVSGSRTPTVAAAPYEELWRRCVVAYKERSGWWLAAPLGRALALAVGHAVVLAGGAPDGVVLVPVPSQGRSVRDRGLDTTLTLARVAARTLTGCGFGVRVEVRLRHGRRVADQSTLGEHERRTNVAGALVARPAALPAGTRIVVDDLATTGATLAEACRALGEAGTPASGCAVVAATPRRSSR